MNLDNNKIYCRQYDEASQMGIFITVKSDIFDTVVTLANHWTKATTKKEKRIYRDVFDRYIDSLAEEGLITDNQAQFLELWLVMGENK